MKKRIFLNMLGLCLLLVVSLTIFLSLVFYNFFRSENKLYLREEAEIIAVTLSSLPDRTSFLDKLDLTQENCRVTLVDNKGAVFYDSYKDATDMDSHAERPEIIQALKEGRGEYSRYSDTLGEETYYYALRLPDGNVLRIAKTTQSFLLIFAKFLPWVLLALAIAVFVAFALAGRLTSKIMLPINALQFDSQDSSVYEELNPLVSKISQQKSLIEEQLQELEKRTDTIDTIIKDMQEGLLLLDEKGDILTANATAIKLCGARQDSYTGKNILELIRDPDVIAKVHSAINGKRQYLHLFKNQRYIEVFCNPVFSNNNVSGANILLLDVTDKTSAENLRREFSANVSHELKTPLTSILGYSEMLENGMAKEKDIPSFAGKIKNQVVHLKKIIDNILKISELDEKTEKEDFEQLDITELTNALADDFFPAALKADVTVEIAQEKHFIFGNKMLITELLTNLLDNAIKYNKKGGTVKIMFAENGSRTSIIIEDTGIGIEREKLERVFERFYRVDPSRSKKTGGTGLGLSIVKHIAAYHGGEVHIDSVAGEKTIVTVYLGTVNS